MNFYNEHDSKAAAWLRELIKQGHIPNGIVDERDIQDIKPDELRGFTQCHFFAGIGGWSLALKLAGWPEKKPAWTGSCPCQPFSSGGKRKGVADERHIWPSFKWLIEQCQPSVVFGEQVASKDGRNWLAGVLFDLEEVGYCATGADLCAAGVGAPHPRQRLYWAASSNANSMRWERLRPEARWSWTVEQFARLVQHCSRVAIPSGKYSLLADGIQSRSPILRGYGNAIVPQVASEFIQAFVEAKQMI